MLEKASPSLEGWKSDCCFTRYGNIEDDHGTAYLTAIYSDDERKS